MPWMMENQRFWCGISGYKHKKSNSINTWLYRCKSILQSEMIRIKNGNKMRVTTENTKKTAETETKNASVKKQMNNQQNLQEKKQKNWAGMQLQETIHIFWNAGTEVSIPDGQMILQHVWNSIAVEKERNIPGDGDRWNLCIWKCMIQSQRQWAGKRGSNDLQKEKNWIFLEQKNGAWNWQEQNWSCWDKVLRERGNR